MIYFKEIYYRCIYVLIVIFLLYFYLIFFENTLLVLLFSGFVNNKVNFSENSETSFIVSSPIQISDIYSEFYFIIVLLFILPYLLWNVLTFLKSSITKDEYKIKKKIFETFFLMFYVSNYFSCAYLFPVLWYLSELVNLVTLNSTFLNINYEPEFARYAKFLFDIIKTNNFFLIFYLTFLYFSSSILNIKNFLVNQKILNLTFFVLVYCFSYFLECSVISSLFVTLLGFFLFSNTLKRFCYFFLLLSFITKKIISIYFCKYEIEKSS